jgi:hypothetical protein
MTAIPCPCAAAKPQQQQKRQGQGGIRIDPASVEKLVAMGFNEELVITALDHCQGDMQHVRKWLLGVQAAIGQAAASTDEDSGERRRRAAVLCRCLPEVHAS